MPSLINYRGDARRGPSPRAWVWVNYGDGCVLHFGRFGMTCRCYILLCNPLIIDLSNFLDPPIYRYPSRATNPTYLRNEGQLKATPDLRGPSRTTLHHHTHTRNKDKGPRPLPLPQALIHPVDLADAMRAHNIRKPTPCARRYGYRPETPFAGRCHLVRRLTLLCLMTASICASTPRQL